MAVTRCWGRGLFVGVLLVFGSCVFTPLCIEVEDPVENGQEAATEKATAEATLETEAMNQGAHDTMVGRKLSGEQCTEDADYMCDSEADIERRCAVHYKALEQEKEKNARIINELELEQVVLPISVAFLCALTAASMVHQCHLSFLPESLLVIGIGVILSLVLRSGFTAFSDEHSLTVFNESLLNLVLLPIIIFESGWTLRGGDFASQLGFILLFAVVGTGIATGIVALLLWSSAGTLHHISHFRSIMAFASLISATDPVATLATYSSLKVDPLLNIIVFGESTINDAVAITLFDVFNNEKIWGDECDEETNPTTGQLVMRVLLGVLVQFFGSIFFGVLLAMIFILILRITYMRNTPSLEILYVFFCPFVTFAFAEVVELSGIIACLFLGIVMGIYARPNLSRTGSWLCGFFLKQAGSIADMAVFFLVGIDIVLISNDGFRLSLVVMLFCLMARACSTCAMAIVTNIYKTCKGKMKGQDPEHWDLLSCAKIFMMWHAGLRGAIALVLCLQLGSWVNVLDGVDTRSMMRDATFIIIIVFLLVFGGSTECFLKLLKIPMGKQEAFDKLIKREDESEINFFLRLSKKLLIPLLVGKERYGVFMETESDKHQNTEVEEVLDKIVTYNESFSRGHHAAFDGDSDDASGSSMDGSSMD